MSLNILQARIYFQHRWLVFLSFVMPVLFLMPLSVASHVRDRGASSMTMFTMFMLAISVAFFLGSVQHELLNKAMCFLMPSVRRVMLNNQLLTGAAVFLVSFTAAFVVPGLTLVVQGSAAMALALASLMLTSYALSLLVVFQFTYASWLPFQIVWMIAVGMKSLLEISPDQIQVLLGQSSLMAIIAAFLTYLMWRQMRSPALFRKLAQQPFISLADLRNTKRMEDYKRARDLHKTQKVEATRPLAGLMQVLNRRVAECRAKGHHVRALVWEACSLSLVTSVPRKRWRLVLFLASFPVAMAALGYVDSRVLQTRSPMPGWFTGLAFMGLISAMGMLALHLRVRTMGRLISRSDMLRAGWLGTGVMLLLGQVVALMLFGLGHLLADILPGLTIGTRTYNMIAPKMHLLGVPLFVLPVQLLVFTFWRKPSSPMVLQQSGTLSFFAFHAAFAMGGVDQVLLPMVLVTASLWLALPWVWRWRVLRADQF